MTFTSLKPRSHLTEYFFPIVDDIDKFSNREQSDTNRNDKMQCVTIYPNIYECVSDYMKIHHDRF